MRPFLLLHTDGTRRLPGEGPWIVFLAAMALIHVLNQRRVFAGAWERLPDWAFSASYGVAVGVVLLFVPQHYAPFIYFQF